MAAYASLLSLGHIIDNLMQYLIPGQMAVPEKAHVDSLLENITFLQDFLEEFSLTRGEEIQELEEKVARSASAAEDIIERHVADHILKNYEARSGSSQNLQNVMKEFDSIKNYVMKIKKTEGIKTLEQPRKSAAEDIIDSRVVDQILPNSKTEWRRGIFSVLHFLNLFKLVTEGIRSMLRPRKDATAGSFVRGTSRSKNTMVGFDEDEETSAPAGSFVQDASKSKNTMVGFDEDLNQIMEKLTGRWSDLRIVSIVGMGGIGKTTLATNVYHHPFIVQHFHVRAWATISQQYSVREILSALLKDIGVPAECNKDINQLTDEEIGEHLHKSLCGRKYLIVMDDVWSTECWDDIKRFFPGNNNGSRVMITTRLTNVADDFRSCAPHKLHLLDEDQSWALFCDKVFGQESCPPELEEVGRTIVRNCGALPLAIVVISGLLANSSRRVEYWEYVANDTYEALNMRGDGLCSEILSLSYKHLPVHLKPCFLYMSISLGCHEISISRLTKLWVAEGILKPMRHRSLEETAEDNLKDLIDRNLIMIHNYGSSNKFRTCTIHDLLRDVCLRKAQKENFLCVTMMDSINNHSKIIDNKRWLIIKQSCYKEECQKRVFDTKSLTYSGLISSERLHRLLIALNMDDICSYEDIMRLVNSRYIDFKAPWYPNMSNALESLPLLWNLQTLIIESHDDDTETGITLPAEIWEMRQLRHLKIEDGVFNLPDPPTSNSRGDIIVLKNLQTLYKIRNFRCTDEMVHRIPNLKKLGISWQFTVFFKWDYDEVYNLSRLSNLESLFVKTDDYLLVPQDLRFLQSLKKLSLERCGVSWKDLTMVGTLPRLEVLKLYFGAVRGREWNPVEGQFLALKCLRIEYSDLEEWTADSSHFPRLEKLQLWHLVRLKEIPYGIGDIPTLRSISLEDCSDSANSSARKVLEEQQNFGNYDLQVQILNKETISRVL
ncbi:putative late blight resistance protein homolog R1A-3 [Henckelia pumila]|uniref:putative late blight resistance protein homolog R1A-3 n=1 Tax=Henckelia pumila TaxID=405737 RepID=UPI003C6DE249